MSAEIGREVEAADIASGEEARRGVAAREDALDVATPARADDRDSRGGRRGGCKRNC